MDDLPCPQLDSQVRLERSNTFIHPFMFAIFWVDISDRSHVAISMINSWEGNNIWKYVLS